MFFNSSMYIAFYRSLTTLEIYFNELLNISSPSYDFVKFLYCQVITKKMNHMDIQSAVCIFIYVYLYIEYFILKYLYTCFFILEY